MQPRPMGRCETALHEWVEFTEDELNPPRTLDAEFRVATERARRCVDDSLAVCNPTSATVMKATGALAVSLLILAFALLDKVSKDPSPRAGTAEEGSGGLSTADTLWLVGATAVLFSGLVCSVACGMATMAHCRRPLPDGPDADANA